MRTAAYDADIRSIEVRIPRWGCYAVVGPDPDGTAVMHSGWGLTLNDVIDRTIRQAIARQDGGNYEFDLAIFGSTKTIEAIVCGRTDTDDITVIRLAAGGTEPPVTIPSRRPPMPQQGWQVRPAQPWDTRAIRIVAGPLAPRVAELAETIPGVVAIGPDQAIAGAVYYHGLTIDGREGYRVDLAVSSKPKAAQILAEHVAWLLDDGPIEADPEAAPFVDLIEATRATPLPSGREMAQTG